MARHGTIGQTAGFIGLVATAARVFSFSGSKLLGHIAMLPAMALIVAYTTIQLRAPGNRCDAGPAL